MFIPLRRIYLRFAIKVRTSDSEQIIALACCPDFWTHFLGIVFATVSLKRTTQMWILFEEANTYPSIEDPRHEATRTTFVTATLPMGNFLRPSVSHIGNSIHLPPPSWRFTISVKRQLSFNIGYSHTGRRFCRSAGHKNDSFGILCSVFSMVRHSRLRHCVKTPWSQVMNDLILW